MNWRFTVGAKGYGSLVSQGPITRTFRITNADRKGFTKYGLLFCVDAHRDGKRFIVKADDCADAISFAGERPDSAKRRERERDAPID